MDDEHRKRDLSSKAKDSMETPSPSASRLSSARTIRTVSPLGMRVLVRIEKGDDVTDGGLYLPENAKDRMSESLLAEIIEVASAIDNETDEETNISGVPLGARVLISKEAGTRLPWDDTLRLVETKDILAVVEEASIS